MKSVLVILFFIALLTSVKLFSQTLEVEVFAGPAMISLLGNRLTENVYDTKLNLVTGFGLRYVLENSWVLGTGIQYDRQGGRTEGTIVIHDANNNPVAQVKANGKLNFDYLTIPVDFAKRFGNKKQFEVGGG